VIDEWTSEIDASFARAICDRLDVIASLGAERRATELPWTAASPVEQRLSDAVDASRRRRGGWRPAEVTSGARGRWFPGWRLSRS